jgi:excisionase family DNA binding protein
MNRGGNILKQQKVTVKAAARMLGISTSFVYKLIHSGDIHYIRIGKSIQIPIDELREYMLENFHD